jgi:hypothetical protein
MNPQPKQSAIARLLGMLRQPHHEYRPTTEVFADLDTDRIATELRLANHGSERGAANRPAQTAQAFDDIENKVIERAESHKQAAHALYLRHLETYDERLTALNFEERFAIIQQAAPEAVGDFRAEAALGRDDLHRLRRRVVECEEERDHFKKRHGLNRPARLSSLGKVVLKVGILAVLFVIEVAINGGFLSKANEGGYLGGAVQAVAFAALNIIVSFLWGLVPIRLLNRRFGFLKLLGFVSLIAYLAFAAGLNLTLSHLREIPPSLTEDVGHQVLVRLQTAPLLLNDINSWVFFGIGFAFSLIAMADGVLFTDPFFGYAPVERRCVESHIHYTDGKAELIERLREIRDTASEVMNEAARDLSLRRNEYDAILQARTRLSQRFIEHQNHIERACQALLSVYREANHAARETPEPGYWARPYKLERIPATGSAPDDSAREHLRRSILEAQEMLKAQITAVHEAFEEAVRSYKEIDDMIPEKSADGAKQKAA